MSGLAGGKVVSLDRVEWIWIPDGETQLNALLKGEIDMLESVASDHLPILEKDKNIRIITGKTSNQFVFRMNWLQPPFNNVKAAWLPPMPSPRRSSCRPISATSVSTVPARRCATRRLPPPPAWTG
jgi:hypothetical protein